MIVDFCFNLKGMEKDKIKVIRKIQTIKEAETYWKQLVEKNGIENINYAYLRVFDGWRRWIHKHLKRREE